MMKFRIWDKKKKKWIRKDEKNLIYPVITPDGHVMILEFSAFDDSATVIDEGSRFEINFFTGLRDVNGKEIYEGDIVKCFSPLWKRQFLNEETVGVIIFERGCFKVKTEKALLAITECNCLAIVGNIYETHELLKEVSHV